MSSLKDQFLKAGLSSKQSAQGGKKNKQPTLSKKARQAASQSSLQAEQAMRDKAQRDKELNLQRQQQAEQKAQQAQIKQLVETSKCDREGGEHAYHFTFAKKVKTLYITEPQQTQLARQQIAIVQLSDQRFELVPKVVADKIAQRDASCIIVNQAKAPAETDQDDPYADYQIPDDLVW